jgi:predicted amidohydrolase
MVSMFFAFDPSELRLTLRSTAILVHVTAVTAPSHHWHSVDNTRAVYMCLCCSVCAHVGRQLEV